MGILRKKVGAWNIKFSYGKVELTKRVENRNIDIVITQIFLKEKEGLKLYNDITTVGKIKKYFF